MIKKITFILLILVSITSFAQESVVFKTEFKPNKKYKTQLKTTSYTEIEFIADQEIMDRIKSQGIELPMIQKAGEVYENAIKEGLGDIDYTGIIEYIKKINE